MKRSLHGDELTFFTNNYDGTAAMRMGLARHLGWTPLEVSDYAAELKHRNDDMALAAHARTLPPEPDEVRVDYAPLILAGAKQKGARDVNEGTTSADAPPTGPATLRNCTGPCGRHDLPLSMFKETHTSRDGISRQCNECLDAGRHGSHTTQRRTRELLHVDVVPPTTPLSKMGDEGDAPPAEPTEPVRDVTLVTVLAARAETPDQARERLGVLESLMGALPVRKGSWPLRDKARWMNAFDAALDMVFDLDDDGTTTTRRRRAG